MILSLLRSYLVVDALASSAAAFAPPQQAPLIHPAATASLHHGSRVRYAVTISKPPPTNAYPTLAISDANLAGLPELRSQDQQIRAALPLGGTVRGTKWRVREERGPAFGGDRSGKSKATTFCTSTVVFQGVAGDSNRGTVEYYPGTCQTDVEAEENGSSSKYGKSKGLRWVSKTTRVIQLTARWKVRLMPEGKKFIYKGYIDGGRRRQIEGKSGQNNLEMTGTILMGEDDSANFPVGKFTADLIEKIEW